MRRRPPLRHAGKFRDYQKRAIQVVRKYRDAFLTQTTSGAALVCHPTGTGKTAVIAALAQAAPEIGSVVILTTREAIRDQLVRELCGGLFIDPEKFALGSRIELPKIVLVVQHSADLKGAVMSAQRATTELLPTALLQFTQRQWKRLIPAADVPLMSLFADGKVVLVMTVQMLESIRDGAREVYKDLSKHSSLIVFDEGHYEPAALWSQVVRGLECPLVLLSATPFRNDLRPFEIVGENIHIYRYEDACKEHVRPVTVIQRARARHVSSFVDDIIAFCTERFGNDQSAWPRVIIHCDESSRITRLGDEFVRRKFTVVGIHDTFSDRHAARPWQYRKVPPPRQTDAAIWIHQYKLLEGIDDHRFRVLALFDPMRNVRWVVQQIGRIIRLTPGESSQEAFVLDHFGGRIGEYWALYRDYDKSLTNEYLAQSLTKLYLDSFIEAHPLVDYFDKKFRRRLVIEEVTNAADEVLFERRVTFRRIRKGIDLSSLATMLEEQFSARDLRYARCLEDPHALMYLYVGLENPPFLQSRFFAEVRHGARLMVVLPGHDLIAVTDTNGGSGSGLGSLPPPDPKRLERLLTPGRYGRITSVSSKNTSLGSRVVRRRTVSAPSIADMPPILDEHGHVVSIVTGYNGDRPRISDDTAYVAPDIDFNFEDVGAATADVEGIDVAGEDGNGPALLRRYVGLANGHVAESGPPLRFRAYRNWVHSLADQMTDGKRPPGVFHRYAQPAARAIRDAVARNLLLDLFDIEDMFVHAETREPIQGDDLCVERTRRGKDGTEESSAHFHIVLNGESHALEVVFRKRSERYRIVSPSLDTTFVARDAADSRTLTQALNELQAFNLIPDDLGVIYVHGRFYAPGLKFGDRFDPSNFFVGQCLYPSPILKRLAVEKGRHVLRIGGAEARDDGEQYDADSVFALIDSWSTTFDSKSLRIPSDWTREYGLERLEFTPSLVICDDMNRESADFILADEKHRRVVIAHAKASATWKPFSASAVQEVCAQAQKNTALLAMFSLQKPEVEKWDKKHNFTGAEKVKLCVNRRIRKPSNIDASQAWTRLKPLLQNPLTQREVWIVLGNMLSARQLADDLRSTTPNPEALQLNHLLQTTIAAVGAAGAKVRILCSP